MAKGNSLGVSHKPKPFQNPRIEISTDAQSDVKKDWQDISPHLIEIGDIILGKGLVVGIGDMHQVSDPVQYYFEFHMKNGTTHRIVAQADLARLIGHEFGVDGPDFVPHVRVFTRVRG